MALADRPPTRHRDASRRRVLATQRGLPPHSNRAQAPALPPHLAAFDAVADAADPHEAQRAIYSQLTALCRRPR
jgi:hypothetical protein